MVKKNSRPARIDSELDDVLREMKEKNEISFVQASKEVARIIKKMKADKEKVRREIKF